MPRKTRRVRVVPRTPIRRPKRTPMLKYVYVAGNSSESVILTRELREIDHDIDQPLRVDVDKQSRTITIRPVKRVIVA
jgi:hypothetical protein